MGRIQMLLVVAGLALAAAPGPRRADAEEPRALSVAVDRGYQPSTLEAREGERVRITFTRHEYGPCTKEVVFPALGIRRELPPEQPVVVELPALKSGEYEFRCGMQMQRGTLVVRPRS